jgi:DNA-binding beta-propeller fold protein YncE
VTAETQIGGNPDGVAVVGGRVYVANYDFGAGRTVTVLNAETLTEVERIEVGCDAPRFLFVDAQDEVVVVCTGETDFETNETTNGAVVVLDGASGDVVTRVELPTPVGTASVGQDAQYAAGAEEVHIVHDADRTIYRFDTASNALTSTLDVGGEQINAVAYDAVGGVLYVGRLDPDAPFTAEGTVTIHDRDGTETGRFDAGVVPSHIAFLRSED